MRINFRSNFFFYSHALFVASSYAMDPPFASRFFSYQYSRLDSTFHLFVGFHYTLKHYGGWIRPVQLRCHYSTVRCVISLHETFQMWFLLWTNGGGSLPCNNDTIFIVFHIFCNFVITLISRCAFLPQEQPPAPIRYQLLTHGFTTLLLIFRCDYRDWNLWV